MAEGLTPGHWIIVPNWEKFQHYKRRDPSWIKVYTELLVKPEYLDLTWPQRGLLHTVWLAYAYHNGTLRVQDVRLYVRSNVRPVRVRRTLESLNHAGFIEFSASKPLALSRARATETEVETETPQTPLSRSPVENRLYAEALTLAASWQGGTSEEFDIGLDIIERKHRTKLSYSDRHKLWDEVLRKRHAQ